MKDDFEPLGQLNTAPIYYDCGKHTAPWNSKGQRCPTCKREEEKLKEFVEKKELIPPTFFDKVQDSGHRREFSTGSVRDRAEGKGRYDLLPPHAIERLARHFENGAKKYGDRNWEKGQPLQSYIDSGLRHAFKLLAGMQDEDHAAAVLWNFACFIETLKRIQEGKLPKELDDWSR